MQKDETKILTDSTLKYLIYGQENYVFALNSQSVSRTYLKKPPLTLQATFLATQRTGIALLA